MYIGETGGFIPERTSIIVEEYFLYEYLSASLNELFKRLVLSPRQTQRIIKNITAAAFPKKYVLKKIIGENDHVQYVTLSQKN